jgi:hypothetical protein
MRTSTAKIFICAALSFGHAHRILRSCTDVLWGKRPFLARGLGLDAYWLPVPGQESVEGLGGMTVGHALQDV